MKKKLLVRALLGIPVGISVGFLITVLISAAIGDGAFYPVAPILMERVGGELRAVALQTGLCALMGAGFAMASVIWELDSWSLARQSGVYFLAAAALVLPVAYLAGWMEPSLVGFLSYLGIFVAIFVGMWLSQYLIWRARIRKMNADVQKARNREE